MRFENQVVLDRRRDAVWKAFDNPENMKKWQPTLRSFEPVSGTPGQPGAVSRLTYDENGRTMVLTETITSRREPDEFSGTYDSGSALNTVRNVFSAQGEQTVWRMEAEFRFKGLFVLMAPFVRGMVRKRLDADTARFKRLLEQGDLG